MAWSHSAHCRNVESGTVPLEQHCWQVLLPCQNEDRDYQKLLNGRNLLALLIVSMVTFDLNHWLCIDRLI